MYTNLKKQIRMTNTPENLTTTHTGKTIEEEDNQERNTKYIKNTQYMTPDKQPASLTISYKKNSQFSTDCFKSFLRGWIRNCLIQPLKLP